MSQHVKKNRSLLMRTLGDQKTRKVLGRFIFSARWMLYPINVGLLAGLAVYVLQFLVHTSHFIIHEAHMDLESMMVVLLGLVDASMVANLIIMIVQGSHQIFIHKFEMVSPADTPQYLDHIDSGILKVKVALSIGSITLVQMLKDFVNLAHVDWDLAVKRMIIHGVALVSALVMAIIWRVTHPASDSVPHPITTPPQKEPAHG